MRVKLVVLSVELVIASEKVAETEAFVATPLVAFAGEVADTDGGVVSVAVPVVNFQVKLVGRALPAASFAAVVMVAVYWVLAAKLTAGTNIALLLPAITVPASAAPPVVLTRVKLAVFSVELLMASEKVTETEEFSAMPLAAFTGEVAETVGDVTTEVLGETVCSGGTSAPPPPPQPDRARIVNRAAEKMFAEKLSLFLRYDIQEASKI